ncbi:MAG TPA: SpoIIE family protein phosphatase [Candidatus Rifleibacterium sp.]|nr:SpoIIE family protein phosphatase [Candidatus Rifleibacterium sp.]HPT46815.1 SpoIIE family protein phosphatase [Candidatus Rifleibacterium sp.]
MEFPRITNNCCVEIDFRQKNCGRQRIGGDVFLSRKLKEQRRVISVLSDGLGSGVKAGVLATLTSVMGLNYMSSFRDPAKAARSIMDTLPVCSERHISYSTFSMVDVDFENEVRIVEYDNPPVLVARGSEIIALERQQVQVNRTDKEPVSISLADFQAVPGDRIIMLSDGVSQSGIGSRALPFGWGIEKAGAYIRSQIEKQADISACELAAAIVDKAWYNNGGRALDDITCGVIYFRQPRQLLIMTGPPYDLKKDRLLADLVKSFPGRKIICGGTTANIVARETGREVHVMLGKIDPELPPDSIMEGVDLITEGILTVGLVARYLEDRRDPETLNQNAATKVLRMLLNSDIINFVVGTRVNEFHQDPNMPVELEIRRNVIKKIAALLENQYLKETSIQYI